MPHRFAALCAATALGIGLLGAGTASAADLPVVGTEECTVAVNADAAVVAAVATLDGAKGLLDLLPATATLEDRTQATDAVNTADEALVKARALATLTLCVEAPVETTDPEPTPTTEPTPDPVESTTPETPAPSTVTVAPTSDPTTTVVVVSVDPTADDGSVANTSGAQVTVVPEGSAQTGAA